MLEVRVGLRICRIESALEARRWLQCELNLSLEQCFSNLTHAGIIWKAWWSKARWISFPGVRVKRSREKHGKLHSSRFSGDWCHWGNDHILEIRDGSKTWSQPFWGRRLDRIHSFGFCRRITQTSLFYQFDQEPGGPFHSSNNTLDASELISHKFLPSSICQCSLLLFSVVSLSITSSKGLLPEYMKAIILCHFVPPYWSFDCFSELEKETFTTPNDIMDVDNKY